MCKVLGLAKSGFYEWKNNLIKLNTEPPKDYQLKRDIENVFYNSREAYGSPRVFHVIKGMGHKVSKSKVERLMRELGLKAKKKKKFKKTTVTSPKDKYAPNLLQIDFTAEAKGQVLLADITYIPLQTRFAYLSVIMDLCTREIVGWELKPHMEASLVVDSLKRAMDHGHTVPNGIFHSDRGSQYASDSVRKMLDFASLRQSMSDTGNCFDNAPMESFFDSLKTELMDGKPFESYTVARKAIFEWIEITYNRERIHTSIGNKTPACYAKELMAKGA